MPDKARLRFNYARDGRPRCAGGLHGLKGHASLHSMGRGLSTVAGIVGGILFELLIGLFIAGQVQINSEGWWALAGSVLGAVLAIAGSVMVIHYEASQREKADRRRFADQIDGALEHVHAFQTAAQGNLPQYTQMRESMQRIVTEYRHICGAMQAFKHNSAEVARAAKLLVPGHADQVHFLASSNHTDSWDAAAHKHVGALRKTLERARAELCV